MKFIALAGCLAVAGIVIAGCSLAKSVGMDFVYQKVALPKDQIFTNISYEPDILPKHRLDLFVPAGTNWPVMVFVYGGGWIAGDKAFKFGGDDVYGNIGRFYASRGIGVAVINYRLLPEVQWRDQLDDAAHATAWVYDHIREYGGDPHRLFLCGHSAGAQIVDRIALDPKPLTDAGVSPEIICGVISVSGAGLDMTDQQTYLMGESPSYFAQYFDTGPNPGDWQKIGSPATYIHAGAPPFLIMCAGGETKALIHQSHLFATELTAAGVTNQLIEVPGQSHARIVITLSRNDKTSGPAILNFINHTIRP